ncbi:hypothetical protein [Thalassospira sp.]|uniref:hypothetical protein n=1 Tax=Thalassospira sp. TaxID=1912094 RepID=UPI0032EFB9F5
MDPLGSQLTIYTNTARAIAPQNRLIVPDENPFSANTSSSDRNSDTHRNANYTTIQLRGSLGDASDLLTQASDDLSRIGDALDEIDALVQIAEESSTLSRQQRAQLNAQIEDYLTVIDDISANSSYESTNLLAEDQTITLQVGSGTSSENRVDAELFASSSEDLASGLSSIDLSDDAGVVNARALVDEAQESLRDRQISISADLVSVATAQDQYRVRQVASDNILQAQLAAAEPSANQESQDRISENLQAYLGGISSQLASQTVTVGGFSLPEPRPDPVPEPNDTPVYDPNAEDGDEFAQDFFGTSSGRETTSQPFNTPANTSAFGGYDRGGNGTPGGGSSAPERQTISVSVDA